MPEINKSDYSCECGYSLLSAYGFLGQKEITRMLLNHIQTMHGQAK